MILVCLLDNTVLGKDNKSCNIARIVVGKAHSSYSGSSSSNTYERSNITHVIRVL